MSGLPVANLERCTDRDVSFRDGLIACAAYLNHDLIQMAGGSRAFQSTAAHDQLERLVTALISAAAELETALDAHDKAFPMDTADRLTLGF